MVDSLPQQKQNEGAFAQTENCKNSRNICMEINCENMLQASNFKRVPEMGDTLFSRLLHLWQL